jgi:hypothetical protein
MPDVAFLIRVQFFPFKQQSGSIVLFQHRKNLQLPLDNPLKFFPLDTRCPRQAEQALHIGAYVLLDGKLSLAMALGMAL